MKGGVLVAAGSPRPQSVPASSLRDIAEHHGCSWHRGGDSQIRGVALASRQVQPGDLFVALPGRSRHGAEFVPEALAQGAVAVLTDPAGVEVLERAGCDAAVIVHESPRGILGAVSREIYHPRQALPQVLAVTGTNGKTSVTFLIEAILRALGEKTALSNTHQRRIGEHAFHTPLTTPEAPELHALLAVAAEEGVGWLALEASAQAIERHRLDAIPIAVAGFTNLSHDHFEDYGDMDNYLAHKLPLFQPEMSSQAVVSLESPWGQKVTERAGVPVTTLGPNDSGAKWTYRVVEPGASGWVFELTTSQGSLRTKISMLGEHMVRNAALAIAMVVRAGFSLDALHRAIGLDAGGINLVVPGRLERVSGSAPIALFVDAGRSQDAYENTFDTLRASFDGRLIVVCGTSGNRDRSKRPLMGQSAARWADVVIVTDDDPRMEDPAQIRSDLLQGARAEGGPLVLEQPRPEVAIRDAVRRAEAGDVVVWMGPGSQSYRDIQGVREPFSARDEARAALVEAGYSLDSEGE